MGGVLKSLFGGSDSTQQSNSTSTSESGNQSYNFLKDSLGGNIGTGNNAFQSIAALLGQGGDAGAAKAGLDNYLGSTGYNFMLDQGSKAITGNAAAKGLLNSGSTAKALTSFGQNIGSQYFNNYLGQLGSLFSGGLQSAGAISGAGGYSNSQSNSSSTGKSNSQNGIIPGLFG